VIIHNRHTFLSYFSTIAILLLGSQTFFAQKLISHDNEIVEISVDSLGHIVILDSSTDLYFYDETKFEKINGLDPKVNLIDNRNEEILCTDADGLYAINDGNHTLLKSLSRGYESLTIDRRDTFVVYTDRDDAYLRIGEKLCYKPPSDSSYSDRGSYLIRDKVIAFDSRGHKEPCADVSYRQSVDFDITTTERYDNTRILIGTRNRGIWMYNNDQYKQFYLPGIALPVNIKSLNYRTPKLWIHTLDSLLYIYDEIKQTLEAIDNSVIDYDIDRWDCIYLNKGKYIEIDTRHTNDKLPYISIGEVRSGYTVIDENQDQSFSRYQNNISVQLISNYPTAHQSIMYEYRNKSKEKWEKLNSNRLYLTDISPGNYHLQIRATANQVHYTSPVGFRYSIASDWRDTVWPIIFGVLSFLLIVLYLSMRRVKNDKSRILYDKKKTELQLAKFKSEQKLGQAQMSPHFIFNALNSISGLIAMGQNKQARKALNDLSQMMRMTLDNSSEESIDIKDEIRFLKKYLSVEKAIRSDSFDYKITYKITDATIPPMIIQPFIENAIIHGVSGLQERTGKIIVSISENTSYITAVVQDNGVGRSAKKKTDSDHQSAAVDIVTNRLSLLDRWGKVTDYVSYEDLYDDNNKALGTKVTILIPKRRL